MTALALLPLLAGCAALDRHAERKIPQYGGVDPSQPGELRKVVLPRHVVAPSDELRVSARPGALGFDDQTVVVQSDGLIDLGFFGEVAVAGLTLPEIEQRIVEQLAPLAARQNLREPVQVAVRLQDGSRTRRYYVLGTVSSPGGFGLTGRETVLDGILQAGLRPNSLPDKAYLVRPHPIGGPDQILKIDWCGITQRGDTLTNYQLMPGDRIYVPGGKPPGLLQTLVGGG
jgi:polysaccharide export outer membrane protein